MHANAIDFDSATPSAKKAAARIDPQVADRLLELLGTDDVFRQLFKNDPQQALQKVGFVESASEVSPAVCFMGIEKLASKTAILNSRAELKAMLTSGLGHQPIQLNVSSTPPRLRR
ncbi:MAG: NHLP-related RiPP peptide [Pseudoxanthomonas sp.]